MSQPQSESYTAAKGGIAALTHALAVSFAGRVRVNSISTGWIDTAYTVYEGPDALQQPTVPPLVPVGFKIPHGVLMTGGEGFNFPDSAGGKVDFGPVAGEAVGDAKVFPCKIQLALEGSADNQDHAFTSLKQHQGPGGKELAHGHGRARDVAVHAPQGTVSPAEGQAVALKDGTQNQYISAAKHDCG